MFKNKEITIKAKKTKKLKEPKEINEFETIEQPEKVKKEKSKKFKVTYTDFEGTEKTSTLKARSRGELAMDMRVRGEEIISIKESQPFWEIEIGRTVPQAVLLQVTRQLAAFTAAGVPIIEALTLLAESTKHKRMQSTLYEMAQDIRSGETLPGAAKTHTSVFPGYYLAILEAADRTGDISAAFETLSFYLERDLNSVRAVKSALYYPVVLILLAIGAVAVLSIVVLPRFVEFFTSLNATLPLPTRMLLSGSSFIATNWWIILLVLLAIIAVFALVRNTDKGRLSQDKLILKFPIFGNLVRLIALERFTRVLGSLTNAGVSLPDALELAANVMNNYAFTVAINDIRLAVLRGEGITDPMSKFPVFPKESVQILRVGEQTGRMSDQLNHASEYYAKEVDYKLKNLTSLIEPVVLLIVGGGVGFVAVALVSAMYGIYNQGNFG
jgi:type IV pilus assembly protein PilC